MMGVEPIRPFELRILSPVRLPLRRKLRFISRFDVNIKPLTIRLFAPSPQKCQAFSGAPNNDVAEWQPLIFLWCR